MCVYGVCVYVCVQYGPVRQHMRNGICRIVHTVHTKQPRLTSAHTHDSCTHDSWIECPNTAHQANTTERYLAGYSRRGPRARTRAACLRPPRYARAAYVCQRTCFSLVPAHAARCTPDTAPQHTPTPMRSPHASRTTAQRKVGWGRRWARRRGCCLTLRRAW